MLGFENTLFYINQPCKKLRKDDDPSTKNITNYFVPLPKPVDKPFSPPRSNNIMDYFRKTPLAQETTTSSQKCSLLQSKELQSSTCEEVSPKINRVPRQKRTRKAMEAMEKEEQDVLANTCILESPDKSPTKKGVSLTLQTNNEIHIDNKPSKSQNTTDTSADERKAKDGVQNPKRKNLATQNQTDCNFVNDKASPQGDKCRIKSAVRRNRKANVSQSETCNTEEDQSLRDASMEVNVDETSVLGCSTITVSFEEFLESQTKNVDQVAPETKSDTFAVESSKATSCMDTVDLVAVVSPRTFTVQAEVHPISPDHKSVKSTQLKVASIFTRNKKDSQMRDVSKPSSDNPQVNTDILPDLIRKSNVVLHEDDLELDVVESSSTPKCTQEERKQFMNAFKQPGLDGSKGKPSKGQSKSKPVKENASETTEPEKKANEPDPDPPILEQSTEQQKPKGVGKKRGRKSVKKGQMDQPEEVPVTPKQDEPPTTELETKCTSVDDGDKQKALRRSTRGQTIRRTPSLSNRIPSPRKTKGREKAEASAACHLDDVAQASTPKSQRLKRNVYRAEMLFPLDKRESPIRYITPPDCV